MRNVLSYYTDPADGALKRRDRVVSGGGGIPQSPNILLDETFDTWTLGVGGSAWNTVYWNQRMANGQNSGVSTQLARHEVKPDPTLGGRMMRLTLLANTQGAAGSTAMVVPLKEPVDEIFMEIKFALGGVGGTYDFGKGQKFPGPSGTYPGVSPDYPTGCKAVTDQGFSQRSMQATHSGHSDGAGMAYLYGTDSGEANWNCGEDGWWTVGGIPGNPEVIMTPGVYHTLTKRSKLNSVSGATVLSDGIAQEWWDGNLVYDRSNRKQRVRSDVHATSLLWHWFYGGADATWAPTSDQIIDIAYVKIWSP